jgi:hypothetical protein
MGDASPEFLPTSPLEEFVVGRWCVVDILTGANPREYYEFKEGSAFEFGMEGGDYKGTGTWKGHEGYFLLTYETINGKPKEEFRAQYKKDEESGGQVAVQRGLLYDQLFQTIERRTALYLDADRKHLTFTQPQKPGVAGSGFGGGGDTGDGGMSAGAMLGGGPVLERMSLQPKKEKK